MMGYDEHWGGSPVAGSVASMPWVKEGLELLMKDVPSHKSSWQYPSTQENGLLI